MKYAILLMTLWAFPSSAQDIYEKVSGFLFGNQCLSYAKTLWKIGDRDAPIEVYFGDCEGNYKLRVKAPKANCHGCGGVKGNPEGPVGNLQIKDGILILTFEGGSRNYVIDSFKWRFDKKINDFLLIGETYTSRDTVGDEPLTRIDSNFSTAKMESSIGKKKLICSFKSERILLSSFNFDNYRPLAPCSSKKAAIKAIPPS